MKTVPAVAAYLFCLITTGLGMLLITLAMVPTVMFSSDRTRGGRVRALIHYLFRGCIGLYRSFGLFKGDLSALDALARQGPLLVVANHPSLMDAQLLVSRLPNAVCIMKSTLSWSPFLGLGARFAGYIPNGSPHGLVRTAVQRLAEGSQLVVFPEGTRTRGRPMEAMKGAFATIARRAGVPVQLVVIDIDSEYLCKGWPVWRIPRLPVTFNLRLSRVLDPSMSRAEMIRAVEEAYQPESPQGIDLRNHPRPDRP